VADIGRWPKCRGFDLSLLTFYKVFFLFNLIFKKVITILKVYNLVNLLLIMFFIIIAVIVLNLYKRLR
jgi:hypothetical protein